MIAMRNNQVFGCRVYEPTPKDIRRVCDEIQATWSPRQRAKRHRGPRAAWWTPPMIRLTEVVEAINGERADSLPSPGAAWNEFDR
jgi:hypothetical protein